MREPIPLFLRVHLPFQMLDPRPSPDIRNRVFPPSVSREIIPSRAGVFAREVDLEHTEDAECLVGVSFDGV